MVSGSSLSPWAPLRCRNLMPASAVMSVNFAKGISAAALVAEAGAVRGGCCGGGAAAGGGDVGEFRQGNLRGRVGGRGGSGERGLLRRGGCRSALEINHRAEDSQRNDDQGEQRAAERVANHRDRKSK